jgi:hypothetical protein
MGLLFDAVPALAAVAMPKVPFAPKFDHRVTRKAGQYCFASEMLAADLQFWHKRAAESAEGGGKWADKDRKHAEELARWIAWRSAFPESRWRGKRGDELVTADAPSRDPELHEWKRGPAADRAPAPETEAPGGGFGDEEYGATPTVADDLPF